MSYAGNIIFESLRERAITKGEVEFEWHVASLCCGAYMTWKQLSYCENDELKNHDFSTCELWILTEEEGAPIPVREYKDIEEWLK